MQDKPQQPVGVMKSTHLNMFGLAASSIMTTHLDCCCRCCCVGSGLRPPVIHRDIKPENVVLEGGQWGGRVFLIDFGGVQGSAGIGECNDAVQKQTERGMSGHQQRQRGGQVGATRDDFGSAA